VRRNFDDGTRLVRCEKGGKEMKASLGLCFFSILACLAVAGCQGPAAAASISPAATPTFNPSGGSYAANQSVTISCATADSTIYYTTDGTTPTTSSAQYSSPVTASVDPATTLKAIAASPGYSTSSVGSASYTIAYPQAAAPTFSPSGGPYAANQSVTISCATADSTIYYTTDGTTPTTSSAQYSGPVTASVDPAATLKAIAAAPLHSASSVGSATYRLYVIGDTGPAGGKIFYDRGSYSDGWRFLEAALGDQTPSHTYIQWWNGSYVFVGTYDWIGEGKYNTATIIAAQGSGSYAASLCAGLSLGGYSDWFLPSRQELYLLYTNRAAAGLGGFGDDAYWSSSQSSKNDACAYYFTTGDLVDHNKLVGNSVRAVRSF
jgi:hypothetical protein